MNNRMTLPEKVIDYIELSSSALEKAAAKENREQAQQAKIASLIPAAVDALVKGERIQESERQKAAAFLNDPVKCLELLTKVAMHRSATEQASLGVPVDATTKSASAGRPGYNSTEDNRVGMRTTMEKKSDLAFKKGLGLA